jgi:Methyltransferase domain
MKTRIDIINYLISKYNYNTYLEIGVSTGECIAAINVNYKDGVDPQPRHPAVNYPITSDIFFANLEPEKKYDLIFIDGLHLYEQVIKDVNNSLKHLQENGIIVLHDCNPTDYLLQIRNIQDFNLSSWTGDVWKAILHFRKKENLNVYVVDTDYGIGLIKPGYQDVYINSFRQKTEEFEYEHLVHDRQNILNLITIEEFLQKF